MSTTTIVNPAVLRSQLKGKSQGDCDMNDFICQYIDLGSCSSDAGCGLDCSDCACGNYQDAPICSNAPADINCSTEIFRGCSFSDCADNQNNPDDKCCANLGIRPGDQIDHAYCSTQDADYGGINLCFWGDAGNPCPDCSFPDWYDWGC